MTPLEAALDYEACGFSVVPIPAGQKRPVIDWMEYQRRRADPLEIAGWWKASPNANVGIICGQVSGGLVVLDVDPRNGGTESLAGKHVPPTPTVRTGGGGVHYWYKAPRLLPSRQLGRGLDFQAEGKLVVAPPSIHPNGNRYAWLDMLALGELEGAEPPAWIMAVASAPADRKPAGWAQEAMETLTEGQRDNRLTQLAGRYFGLRIRGPEVLKILLAINAAYCKPPLTEADVQRIVGSIGRKEGAKPAAPMDRDEALRLHAAHVAEVDELVRDFMSAIGVRLSAEAAGLHEAGENLVRRACAGEIGRDAFVRGLFKLKADWKALRQAVAF